MGQRRISAAGNPAPEAVIIMPESPVSLDTRWPAITKRPGEWSVAPNLVDYEKTRAEFSWIRARAELDGLPGGRGLNIAHEAVDRHAASARRERVALRWLSKDGERRDFTRPRGGDELFLEAGVKRRAGQDE